MKSNKVNHLILLLCVIILILSAIVSIFIGTIPISPRLVWGSLLHRFHISGGIIVPAYYDMVIWQLRLPRIMMSLLSGAALAICGCVFQSIFRNPICDPYILGISSGASLGAAISIVLGLDTLMFGVTVPALLCAILTLLLIMGIARVRNRQSTQTLLLTGIAINFFISAFVTLLMVVCKQDMQKIFFWTMGSLSTTMWTDVLCLLPILAASIIILYIYAKDLNIMQMGTESAQSLGVNTQRTLYVTLITSSLLIGVVVSFCGVIGFIGLIVPHICRLIVGSDNRRLFTYSLLAGGFFLLVADTLARTLAAPSELPVGSITALAGAPYFIYLVIRKQ